MISYCLILQIQMQQHGWRRAQHEQEEHIDEIHQLAYRMRVAGLTLNEQLQRQEGVIEVLHGQMETTQGFLGDVQKEIGQLLQTRDINQVCTCCMLCCFMMVLIILIFVF